MIDPFIGGMAALCVSRTRISNASNVNDQKEWKPLVGVLKGQVVLFPKRSLYIKTVRIKTVY